MWQANKLAFAMLYEEYDIMEQEVMCTSLGLATSWAIAKLCLVKAVHLINLFDIFN